MREPRAPVGERAGDRRRRAQWRSDHHALCGPDIGASDARPGRFFRARRARPAREAPADRLPARLLLERGEPRLPRRPGRRATRTPRAVAEVWLHAARRGRVAVAAAVALAPEAPPADLSRPRARRPRQLRRPLHLQAHRT